MLQTNLDATYELAAVWDQLFQTSSDVQMQLDRIETRLSDLDPADGNEIAAAVRAIRASVTFRERTSDKLAYVVGLLSRDFELSAEPEMHSYANDADLTSIDYVRSSDPVMEDLIRKIGSEHFMCRA